MNWEKYGIDISRVRGGKGYCPKCHDTRKNKHDPSLSVDLQTGLFNCHNFPCDFKGCAADKNDMTTRIKKDYIRPPERLQKVSDEILGWFEGRGISNDTLLRLKITEAVEWMPQTQSELQCVCYNYIENDELVNIKFRGPDKEFKMVSGAKLIFYNIDALKGETECCVVEGENDVCAAVESGIYNCVSVPNGASKSSNAKLEYLDNCVAAFDGMKKIVLATDNDEPGISLRDELARRLGKDRCYKVEYPTGTKDLNEVLIKYGKDAVRDMYNNARPFPVEGILTLEDFYGDVQSLYLNGYPKGLKVGIPGFDDHLSFDSENGQLWVITAAPGAGKSEFVDYIMAQMRKLYNWRWGCFSFESQPSAVHATLIMEKLVGKSFHPRADKTKCMTQQEAEWAAGMVDEHFYFVNMDEADLSMDGILEKCKQLVMHRGVKGIVVDPWNFVESKQEKGESETQYINRCLTKMKMFTTKYGCHLILIAHPIKLRKLDNGKYEVPTLYHISGSAHFFNKADNGFTLWRDYETGEVQLHVQKVKRSWLGQLGMVQFNYNTISRQYEKLNF